MQTSLPIRCDPSGEPWLLSRGVKRLLVSLAALSLVMGSEDPPNDETDAKSVGPDTVTSGELAVGVRDARIADALSAGPASITSGAAIMDRSAEMGGQMIELRPGTNGWVCMPSIPAAAGAPGFGPMCLDSPSREFFAAMRNREEPAIESIGIAYMLQGNVQGSATDPLRKRSHARQSMGRDGSLPHDRDAGYCGAGSSLRRSRPWSADYVEGDALRPRHGSSCGPPGTAEQVSRGMPLVLSDNLGAAAYVRVAMGEGPPAPPARRLETQSTRTSALAMRELFRQISSVQAH